MRDAITWSYDLLSPEEQELFCRLAVFGDGFTLEAAEALETAGDEETGRREDGKTAKRRSGIYSRRPAVPPSRRPRPGELAGRQEPGGARYDGGGDALPLAGDDSGVCRRATPGEWVRGRCPATACSVHAGVCRAARADAVYPLSAADLAPLEREGSNFQVALEWPAAAGDPEEFVRLCAALGWFWWQDGHWAEGRRWLGLAWDRIPAGDQAGTPLAIPISLAVLLVSGTADLDRAEAIIVAGLERCRAVGDAFGGASLLLVRGWLHHQAGRFDEAGKWLEEALAAADTVAPPERATTLRAAILNNLGGWARACNLLPEAAAFHEDAIDLNRTAGHLRGVVSGLVDLGSVEVARGDTGRAIAFFREGLGLMLEQPDLRYGIAALERLGEALATSAPDQAVRLWAWPGRCTRPPASRRRLPYLRRIASAPWRRADEPWVPMPSRRPGRLAGRSI